VEVVKSGYSANIIARAEVMGRDSSRRSFTGTDPGAVIVGDHAPELLAPLALAVSAGLTRGQLQSWVLPHPTLGEVLVPLIDG
jgi:pyruvate/2-oxoglutarate dehydrogenase complex dihydrolipoamide dehydrogenase (E3) component